jgi:hypothetical protein
MRSSLHILVYATTLTVSCICFPVTSTLSIQTHKLLAFNNTYWVLQNTGSGDRVLYCGKVASVAVLSLCNKQKSCHISWAALRRRTAAKRSETVPLLRSLRWIYNVNPHALSARIQVGPHWKRSIKRFSSHRCLHWAGDTKIQRVISSTRNANVSIHAALQMRWDCAHAIGRDESHQKQKNLSLSSARTHTHTHTSRNLPANASSPSLGNGHAVSPTQHSKRQLLCTSHKSRARPCNTDRYRPNPSRHNRFLPYPAQFITERCTGSHWQNQQWYIIYLTAFGLPPGGSSTVHICTQTIHNNTMKQNTQNGTHISIRIHNLQN